ncbi:MAG TPA: asparagine synthase (glutamine-hydrolyzing) [Mycobacteriales bacterium]|nr:asparagine synthase (glutamine-hydrolyzing) [Mycobacteriales bacterium]
MCGIVGVRRLDGAPVDPRLLATMAERLRHRGPDDIGYWVDGPVGFGHTRLSIIDIAGSSQPMSTPDGRWTVTFNGEILNYREVRERLAYPFRTKGDTEVLLAAHDGLGLAGVEQLRGQFAYGLWDAVDGALHLFRDRMGILPLYYYADSTVFAFASEIKALLPVIPRPSVDQDSLPDYLAHRSVPAPFTLVAGVRKLPQGHRLTLAAGGRITVTPYWELPNEPTERRVAPAQAVELVADALTASVAEALIADVPVGAYLSGGLDSSLITALVAKARGGGTVQTYSAGFGDPRVDELPWARRVSGLLGTEHHDVVVTAADFTELWPRLTWHRDAPLSEPADVAVFRLAEMARRDVKVTLSGEGSDELFGGYPKYRAARLVEWAGVLPAGVRAGALGRLERALPARLSRLGILLRAAQAGTAAERMRGWFAPFTEAERARLLGRAPRRANSLAPYQRARGDVIRRMLYADSHFWLADNLLERGDRMSMAASLELRPPFLDHRLVELAFSLPSSVKVRGGTTKWVVKEVARRYLPADVVDRRKVGFRVPLDSWFRSGLREMAWDLLTGPSSFVADILDRTAVNALLTGHDRAVRDEQARLWTLLSLEVWHREFSRACREEVTA